jgi:hypothetical protein
MAKSPHSLPVRIAYRKFLRPTSFSEALLLAGTARGERLMRPSEVRSAFSPQRDPLGDGAPQEMDRPNGIFSVPSPTQRREQAQLVSLGGMPGEKRGRKGDPSPAPAGSGRPRKSQTRRQQRTTAGVTSSHGAQAKPSASVPRSATREEDYFNGRYSTRGTHSSGLEVCAINSRSITAWMKVMSSWGA